MRIDELKRSVERQEDTWVSLLNAERVRADQLLESIRDRLLAFSGAGIALTITAAVGLGSTSDDKQLIVPFAAFGAAIIGTLLLAFQSAWIANKFSEASLEPPEYLRVLREQIGEIGDLVEDDLEGEVAERFDRVIERSKQILAESRPGAQFIREFGVTERSTSLIFLIVVGALNVIGLVSLVIYVVMESGLLSGTLS